MSTPSEDQDQFNPSQQLGDLLFLVLDHGVNSISEGGPLVPFVVSDFEGRTLNRFVAEPYEKSVAEAKTSVSKLPSNASLYALAYDGFITIDGKKYDAIIVHGAERGMGKAYMVAQRYSPSLNGTPLKPIGNPAFIGREDALFNSQL